MKHKKKIESFLRVNHAGEFAATKIYEGQLKVLGKSSVAPALYEMLSQEQKHFSKYDEALKENNVHPSLFNPVWEKMGYGLGALTALLGKKGAMACTIAVEEVIENHYKSQIDAFPKAGQTKIKDLITDCYKDEIAHKETAIHHNGEEISGYETLSKIIKTGCKAAIWLSKRA